MFLVIAEKPSVALSIGHALGGVSKKDGYAAGKGFDVSWCYGHLAEYAPPEEYDEEMKKWSLFLLPFFPEEWKLSVSNDKAGQVAVLKKLLNDKKYAYVVNACDAGREGELIFKRIYDISKTGLPAKRLWISSMEEKAVRDGFAALKDSSEYDDLKKAAECRARADWLVGINASRGFSCAYNNNFSVGRVQSPTVAMIRERDLQIENFIRVPYFHAHLLDKSGLDAVSERFAKKEEAKKLADLCKGKDAVISSLKKEEKKTAPPKLYDLTSLQRDANAWFSMTADATLKAAQSLYEKKFITYPRTDSRFLTSDMEETAKRVLKSVETGMVGTMPFKTGAEKEKNIKKLLNDKKVSDHHAIIPTESSENVPFQALFANEQKVFALICARLFEAVGDEHKYLAFKARVTCEGHAFSASGKTVTENGWMDDAEILKDFFKLPAKKDGKCHLASLNEGDVLKNVNTKVTEHETKPPAHFTENTLLAAMEKAGTKEMEKEVERKGLGTTATRAAIIEKIISTGYVKREKKNLLITEKGKALCEILPNELKSASLTADWENRLLDVEKGEEDAKGFEEDIKKFTEGIIEKCKNVPKEERTKYSKASVRESLGECPWCGSPVYAGKSSFYCSDKACRFAIWKNDRFLKSQSLSVTESFAKTMLGKGKALRTLTSKKSGKKYKAYILFDFSKKENGWVNYKLEFANKKGEKNG